MSFWTLINKYVEDIQTSLIAYGNTFHKVKTNSQLGMSLVMEAKSDVVKNNIA